MCELVVKKKWSPTFHISLSFEHDEGVTPTTRVFVTNDSYALDGPKTFELPSEITLCRGFWLEEHAR
jgi:hypothetical protein